MGQTGSPASNIVYDLVSVQYHALKGAQVYDQFISDAQGNNDVRQFFERVKQEDAKRAQECHRLLTQVTKDGLGGEAYPTESGSKTTQTTNA